jgi:uncharacterized protein
MSIDYERLWRYVIAQNPRPFRSAHGPRHWSRVEANGVMIAAGVGADIDVVRLFAVLHDSQRINEGVDPDHGRRGAELAARLRGELFELSDARFQTLCEACVHHTDGVRHADPTIGTCWDADRLDLPRVGWRPDEAFLSTSLGRQVATLQAGSTAAVIALAPRYPPLVQHVYAWLAGVGARAASK